jgi:hypothetical protein
MKKLFAVVALALVAGACGDPTTPAAPTPATATIIETFNGTLTVLGSNMHAFNVQQLGGLKVTLTSVTPSAIVVLGIGTVTGATCTVVTTVTAQPSSTPQLSGNATVPGPFCVSIADGGVLAEPADYSITVIHS